MVAAGPSNRKAFSSSMRNPASRMVFVSSSTNRGMPSVFGQDLVNDLVWQRLPTGDCLDDGRAVAFGQPVEIIVGDMPAGRPWRLELRAVSDQLKHRQVMDLVDQIAQQFERSRVAPMGIFKQHQKWGIAAPGAEQIPQKPSVFLLFVSAVPVRLADSGPVEGKAAPQTGPRQG